jgi:hypothetical protein
MSDFKALSDQFDEDVVKVFDLRPVLKGEKQ